ncbi:AAA family ATPase [Streptomyces nodosus]|uniref:AmphRI n=1 Tax=Streptomyces nodosus TaxID=40318 RepID=Q5QES7_9ACTN|nr:AAA family ATPase [Streptomyces nodosus]AAV37059.1 AmphRI [Streptomyces nodosus]AJE44527.1 AmphRI transcriptional regulator [Streptomyces nodosus]MBB4789935.1 DNA-binding CsgD family transcriptional regulator/tetratricopeptide (TPR) repeat protein [Streptomyces nodosus]QEV37664.1 helix-turn-helix transcriptional regulator [Streptomyces nodosus]
MIHGRDNELTALGAQAAAASHGETRCAVLTAPSGYGKSALLDALLRSPACQDMTVLRGRCGGASAGAGAYAGLRTLFAPADAPAPDHHPEAAGADDPAVFLPGPGDGRPFTLTSAYPVFRRLSSHVLRLTADRPLVLVLDDAHHCDEHSLRWLDFLLRRAAGRPLLVLLARSSGAQLRAPRAWADLLAHPAVSVTSLGPLGADAVGGLARQVFGVPAHPLLAQQVAAVTAGNPRTVERLLGELRSQGAAPDEAGAQRASELGGAMAAGSVRQLLDREPPEVRSVATAIALLDGTRPPECVTVLADVDQAQADEAIAVLRHAGALTPDGAGLVHEAVRSELLEPLGSRRTAELHARAALLLSDAGRPVEQVAQHLMRMPCAQEPWMSAVLRDAAARAEQRGAFAEAAGYLRRVLEAEPDDAEARLRLALAVAPEDPLSAVPLFRTALAGTPDTFARAGIAVQYAMACLSLPLPATCRAEILGALEAARDALGSGPERDRLRDQVAAVLLLMGRRGTGVAARQHPVTAALPYQPRTDLLQAEALAGLRTALAGHSRETALKEARHAVAAASPQQPPWLLFTAAITLGLADETTEAHRALDAMLRRGGDEPTAWVRVLAGSLRSFLLHRDGAVLDAAAEARSAIDTVDRTGCDVRLVAARAVLASVLVDRGEPRQAERLLSRMGRTEPHRSALASLLYLHARARTRWATGHPAQALRLLRECGWAQETAGVQNPVLAPWWADTCLILAAVRRPADGRELAEQGAERARRWGTPRALGLAALAEGVLTPGRAGLDLLTEAAHQLSTSPAVAEYARAEHALGQALLQYGDEAGARERLRRAAGIAGGCGALALAESARRLLVSAGGRMGHTPGTPAGGLLTTTELKVAGLAVSGASNRQIAQRLFVTVRTVESHLTNVYRKLGVRRRDQLVVALRAVHGRSWPLPGWPVPEGA